MDPSCDVMVAYKQNERFLAPDHGFPIRMIIPGHIGEPVSLIVPQNWPCRMSCIGRGGPAAKIYAFLPVSALCQPRLFQRIHRLGERFALTCL